MTRVAFRADASLRIGTGHAMRCLALADALRAAGAGCQFIARDLPGHLGARIAGQGMRCTLLPAPDGPAPEGPPDHAAWAGVPWDEDAAQTRAALADDPPDWLVLDHYAFDARWQGAALPGGTRLAVLDDLADRPHAADLLLDPTLGRSNAEYRPLVPPHCTLLLGPEHALLRPEFSAARETALAARVLRPLGHLLISMGGVDLPDATSQILRALRGCTLPADAKITVVMGRNAPALDNVRALAAALPWPTQTLVDVTDMAALLAEADLAIGAPGSSAWERCCLGLPSLIMVIAENQKGIGRALDGAGAARLVTPETLPHAFDELAQPGHLAAMSARAAALTDGQGATRLAQRLMDPPA